MPSDFEQHINNKLANLQTEFNQNKGFGFIGMLENNHDPQSDAARMAVESYQNSFAPQAAPQAPAAAPAAAPSQEINARQAAEIMEPINNVVQDLRTEFGNTASELVNIKNQLHELRSLQSVAPGATDGAPDPFGAKLQAQISSMEDLYKKMHTTQMQDRALSALQSTRQKFPDANLGQNDFDTVWKGNGLDQNPAAAERVNWQQHWEMVAKSKSHDKAVERIKNAEAELERLRTNRPNPISEMSSTPRTSRTSGAGLPQSTILGAEGFDEELYQEAVDIMGGTDRAKGRFMGFNRALNEAQRRKSLRGAS